jgi:hypothetical protein
MGPRVLRILSVISACLLTGCATGPFEANDTGGIIAWSPEAEAASRDIAMTHCARYNKVARITSITARYGDYIGFECLWPLATPAPVVRARY